MSMGSALRKLKSKLLTSKKGQEMAKKDNGPVVEGADLITPTNGAVPDEERIILSPEQAQLFATLFAQSKEIQERIQFALVSAGLGGMDIVSGELDASDPHFMVRKSDNGIVT
jgi:hypothetical protein